MSISHELANQIGEGITQLITFLIFFWIMKKYAWPVVIKILDERRQAIEDGFADIERKKTQAGESLKQYEAKLAGIEQEARQRIQEAVAEGRRVAQEITEQARQDATEIADRSQRNIQLEVAKARTALRDEIVTLTMEVTQRLLGEKLDEAADRRLVSSFIGELEDKSR
jgi:F-type H+-transporting ATPase subunit b